MNCGEFIDILPGYFDSAFNETTEKEFIEHMRVCNQCTIKYNRMKFYFERLQDVPAVIPVPKQDQDELIRNLQKEIGTSEGVGSNAKASAGTALNATAELGRVEMVHDKRRKKETGPINATLVYFFVGIIIVLIGVYAFFTLKK